MSDPVPPRISRPSLALDVAERDDNHVVLTFSNVLLVLWSGAQEPAVCHGLYDVSVRLANRLGCGKIAAVSIIQPGTTAPSPKAREALGRLIEDKSGVIYRSALVYPNDGFLASIVRSIALSLMQRSARRHGHQVFQRIDQAMTWVTEGLPTTSGQPISVPTLIRALEPYLQPARSRVA